MWHQFKKRVKNMSKKIAAFKCDPIKTYLFDVDKNAF